MGAVTIYDTDRQGRSDAAHLAARKLIYPRLFDLPQQVLIYDSPRDLDLDLGIDVVVKVKSPDKRFVLPIPISCAQERFREPSNRGYRTITITAWNHMSGQPSELYKFCPPHHFVYGYYDADEDRLFDWRVYRLNNLLKGLAIGTVKFQMQFNERKKQTYVEVPFAELKRYLVLSGGRSQ